MRVLSLLAAVLLLFSAAVAYAQLSDLRGFNYNPHAQPKAVVMHGNARFTVLTDRVIRMEYSESLFEDRATLAIVNRNLPVPAFTNTTNAGTLTITTNYLVLTYKWGTGPFNANNLQITSTTGAFSPAYTFGTPDTGNLLGTIRSLDGHCTIPLDCNQNQGTQTNGEDLHCAWGVVSRGGWTTINDTKNFIMGAQPTDWFSATNRGSSSIDVYFLGHGQDYKAALYDFTRIGGNVPIPSRPLLGSWFTRWFDYDHSDLQRLLDIFRDNGIPLDVLILDMNWHQKNAWTGWTWDGQLYPYPNATLEMIRKRGLMTGANIHDAEGVSSWEAKYAAFCQAVGVDPANGATVQFQPLSATYMRAVEDVLLTFAGFDYYWTDWQQGGTNGGCNGFQLNPTFITDHVRWSDNMRRGVDKRSNTFSRFGGLGSHRYPVGFTGDVSWLTWECMSYQPYFSVTASNVGYGYPSHDLVGPSSDHEIHVRWMQFGAFSGIMRIHDRGMSSGSCWDLGICGIVDIWTLPFEFFDAIKKAMVARVALLPYIYRHARKAYDTGLNVVHGLYYEWPSESEAYNLGPAPGNQAEYMFGDDIVVAVITGPADPNSNLVAVSLWVPPGTWYDNVFGRLQTGPQTIQQLYALADIPMLIRAGAVIPRIRHASKQGVAADPFHEVDYHIYPGATAFSGQVLYEDDGQTWGYLNAGNASVAWTTVSYARDTDTSISITVGAATPTQPPRITPTLRKTRFVLVSMAPIASATCNGQTVTYDQDGGVLTWHYDGFNGQAVIECGALPTNAPAQIEATFVTGDAAGTPLANAKGYASRTQLAKHILDNRQKVPGSHNPEPGWTKQAGSHAAMLSGMAPSASGAQFDGVTGAAYTTLINNAIAELGGNPTPTTPPPPMTSLIQLYDQDRNDMCLCGSHDCLNVNSYYTVQWVEGYQPAGGASADSSVQFNDFWSLANSDNWGDTGRILPAGYTQAIFTNGWVLDAPKPGTTGPICLQVWQGKNDHMTLSSQQGLTYAKDNGYNLVEDCIGYTLTQSDDKTNARTGRDIYHEALLSLQAEKKHSANKTIFARDLLQRVDQMRSGKAWSLEASMSSTADNAAFAHHHPRRAGSIHNVKKQHFETQKKQQKKKLADDSQESAVARAVALLQSAL